MIKRIALMIAAALFVAFAAYAAPSSGEYTGVARGYADEIGVTLTLKDGEIADFVISAQSETPEYGGRAVEALPGIITRANSLGVDAVSGATITSRAILRAGADALTGAGLDPADFGYVPVEDIQAADVVTIIGLPGGDASITGAELMAFESVTVNADSVTASGDSTPTTATGVTLEAVLNSLGTSVKNYNSAVFTATDGYSIEVPTDVLHARDIVIAWDVNGAPHSPRTVVPDARAMYWVKFLARIELRGAVSADEIGEVFFLESLAASAERSAYAYKGSEDEAVRMRDLIEALSLTAAPEAVYLEALDGWHKNDAYETVLEQFMKLTGEDAPMFIGPSLPEGMRLKETLLFGAGGKRVLSAEMALKKLGSAKLKDALALAGLYADAITLVMLDGSTAAVSTDAELSIGDGLVIVTAEGIHLSGVLKVAR